MSDIQSKPIDNNLSPDEAAHLGAFPEDALNETDALASVTDAKKTAEEVFK
jgi:hypothetical protein